MKQYFYTLLHLFYHAGIEHLRITKPNPSPMYSPTAALAIDRRRRMIK